jgi:hypothetical protein
MRGDNDRKRGNGNGRPGRHELDHEHARDLEHADHVEHDAKQQEPSSKGLIWLWRRRVRRAW